MFSILDRILNSVYTLRTENNENDKLTKRGSSNDSLAEWLRR